MLKEPKFVYGVDMDVSKLLSLEPRTWDFISQLEPKVGLVEHMPNERVSGDLISIIHDGKKNDTESDANFKTKRDKACRPIDKIDSFFINRQIMTISTI
jgi:hypothetical protein